MKVLSLNNIKKKIQRDLKQAEKMMNTRNLYWYNSGMQNVISIIKECLNKKDDYIRIRNNKNVCGEIVKRFKRKVK